MCGENEKRRLDKGKVLYRLAALCSRKECCEWDIREKLKVYELNNENKESIIEHLKSEGYIDEERYANSFVNDKYKFNRWGEAKIIYALKMKRIDVDIISKAIATISKERYSEILVTLIENKAKTVKATSEREKKDKLIRFALGRGYSMGEVIKCIEGLNLKRED